MKQHIYFLEREQALMEINKAPGDPNYIGKLTEKTISRIEKVLKITTLSLDDITLLLVIDRKFKYQPVLFSDRIGKNHDEYLKTKDEKYRVYIYGVNKKQGVSDRIKPKLEDKMLVWAWAKSDENDTLRDSGFYDAENKCLFTCNGHRIGLSYDNYEPFEGEYPDWAKKAYDKLED